MKKYYLIGNALFYLWIALTVAGIWNRVYRWEFIATGSFCFIVGIIFACVGEETN